MPSINILGLGTMGVQIAVLFEILGYQVSVWNRVFDDAKRKRLAVEKKLILKMLGKTEATGSIMFVERIESLQAAATIEAVKEDLDIKRSVIGKLSFDFNKTVLFTNSSSFSPGEIAPSAAALHFFNPLCSVRLIETTVDRENIAESGTQILVDLEEHGFKVIVTKGNRGNVGNYILFHEISAAFKLIDRYRYDCDTVDAVMKTLGRQTSIFDIVDYVGVDVTLSILQNLKEQDAAFYIPDVLRQALSQEIFGRKNKTSVRRLVNQLAGVSGAS